MKYCHLAPFLTFLLVTSEVKAQELIRGEVASSVNSQASSAAIISETGTDTGATVVQPYPSVDAVSFPETPVSLQGNASEALDDLSKNTGGNKAWAPKFYLNTTMVYDSNIFIRSTMEEADTAIDITPGIVLGWGAWQTNLPRVGSFSDDRRIPVESGEEDRYVYFDYHPSFIFYDKFDSEDAVDQDASITASYRFMKLTLDGELHYQRLSGADLDTGDREGRDLLKGSIGATYEYTTKTSYEMRFSLDARAYEKSSDSTEGVIQNWLNYQYSSKTQIGAGFHLGYLNSDSGFDQTYEQAAVRVRWAATAQLSIDSTVGLELRQTDSNGGDRVDAVFAQNVQYQPYDTALVSFTASRYTEASASDQGENVTYTRFRLGLQQTLYQRWYISLDGEYVRATYDSALGNTNANRSDDRFTFGLGVGLDFTEFAGIQLAYTARRNDSNVPSRAFTENIFSLQISVLF